MSFKISRVIFWASSTKRVGTLPSSYCLRKKASNNFNERSYARSVGTLKASIIARRKELDVLIFGAMSNRIVYNSFSLNSSNKRFRMLVLPDPIAPYIYKGAVLWVVIYCTFAVACFTWSLRYKKRGLGESLKGSSSRRKYSSTSIYLKYWHTLEN